MKLSQLPSRCAACREPITFPCYRLRIELVVQNVAAARRVFGVAQILGGLGNPGALGVASALAGDEDLATCAGDEHPELLTTRFVCVSCVCADPLLARMIDGDKSQQEDPSGVV